MAAREGRVLRPQNIPRFGGEPCSFPMACGLKDNLIHFKVRSCSVLKKTLPVNLLLHPVAGCALLDPSLFIVSHKLSWLSGPHFLLVCVQINLYGNSADREGRTAGRDTLMGKDQSDSGKI